MDNFVNVFRNAMSANTDPRAEYNVAKVTGPWTGGNEANKGHESAPAQPVQEEKLDTGAVEYTYKKGDTFGQVLLDLGLSQPENLWGDDGDVAYYTKQLRSQGINGNVPIGTKISLLPRKRQ